MDGRSTVLVVRARVFLNAQSGADGPDASALAATFAEAGVQAEVRPMPDDLADAVRQAAAETDVVVVGGGDGTIRTAAEALGPESVPLGVLPMGTFNHFARGLDIPEDIEGAVRVIATGRPRVLSGGRIEGRLFLNTCSLGLAPFVADRRPDSHGSRVARAVEAVPAALDALVHVDHIHLAVHPDDGPTEPDTPFVFVTPNAYEMDPLHFAVRGRRDDGRLNVYVATPDGPFDAVRMAARVLRGHLDRHLKASVAARLEIVAPHARVPVLIDGDLVRLAPPLVVEGVREAVRVIVPA